MGWLSNNFPTIARLIGGGTKSASGARQTPERSRRRARSAETPQPTIDNSAPKTESGSPVGVAEGQARSPAAASEATTNEAAAAVESKFPPEPALPDAVSTESGAGEAGGQALGNTPATISEDSSIEQMYNTWVELEGTIIAAQTELRTMLGNRENAEAMRSEAQEAMVQADEAWHEAGLLGEAAWRAFERGFSVDSPDFVNRLRVIREVDEARKAQAQLQRVSNLEAWKEADRARQNATADILKALTALAAAAAQVSRELRETNYLPDSANSLRSSALDDLRCAHAIGEELALLGQEALSQLGASRLAEQAQIQERMANEASIRQAKIQPPTGDATPLQEFSDLVASEPAPTAIPQETPPAPDPTPTVENAPSAGRRRVRATPEPAPEPEPASASSPVPSPQELMSAAEQLRKEFEVSGSAPSETPGQTVIQGANGEVIEAGAGPEAAPDVPLSAAEELQREMASMRPDSTDSEPADETPSVPLPESYSGKVYLMFPATLDQDQVGSIWEALDDLAGSGAIVDSRLVSQEEGVQFTLELGTKTLTLEALKKKMPGADMTALKEDRLKVNWPKPR